MTLTVTLKDTKTKRAFRRLENALSSCGFGYTVIYEGAPKQALKVSFQPWHMKDIQSIVLDALSDKKQA